MDGSVQIIVKNEMKSEVDSHHAGEFIIPDFVTSENTSANDDFDMEKAIKTEPSETSSFMDADDLENPYQCFECGLDCESQGELIDHYETAHTEESSRKSNYNGSSCPEADGTDDPLAGDVAPDSPEKTANVEGAQNDATPQEVLLLYACPCCGHSSSDWNHLVKHIEKHVKVTCLSCPDCMLIFSSSYRLKDYTGKDPADKPHVCYHCPFKTQWYQVLKDHCVTHHSNTVPMNSSNHYHQNYTPRNGSKLIANSISQTTSVHAAFETVTSHPQSFVPPLAFPNNVNRPGCYVIVNNSIPSEQKVGNIAVSVNSFMPGIHGTQMGSNCVNIRPQVLHLNPMNPSPEPTVQLGVNERTGAVNTLSNLPNQEIHPRLIPKLEGPAESNPPVPLRLPIPKAANRTLPTKVPVNELLKKWAFPSVAPKLLPTKVLQASPKPVLQPNPSILLTGMPSCTAPRGSLEKSRKGIKTKPCPYCSHVARDAHSLRTHIFVHTKEKPFACEICNYRATQRAHIQKHMATHVKGSRRGKYHRAGEGTIER